MTIKATRKSWFDTDAQATTSATSSTWYASAPTDHYSTSQAAVQLTRSGLSWNGYQVYNKPVALTFSFLDSTTTASPRGDKGIVAFNSAQQAARCSRYRPGPIWPTLNSPKLRRADG
ncbi:MAG: hypothetical protein E7B29_19985 [Mixta calida]|nr:hypothetical protein [Mixta calida]